MVAIVLGLTLNDRLGMSCALPPIMAVGAGATVTMAFGPIAADSPTMRLLVASA